MIWSLRFLWYFWTFVLSVPLLLIPGWPRRFAEHRDDLVRELVENKL